MLQPFVLGLSLLVLSSDLVSAHRRNTHGHGGHNNNEPGVPLFLTPLLNEGKSQEARRAAEVPGRQFLNIRSYAGYLTVNEQYNSNMFFWYIPTKINPETAPIIVWLEGGPGASSLFGQFIENGPIESTSDGKIKPREFSWNKYYNMIYIDNPVGSGYSFTENDNGYAKNEEDVARDLYEAVKQLYKLFPEFASLQLYIAGSSYAGKFVPALGYKIYKTQADCKKAGKTLPIHINLAGLAIGNGFSDPLIQIEYGQNLYNLGLIDEDGLETFKQMEAEIHACVRKSDIGCVETVAQKLTTNAMGTTQGTVFGNSTGYGHLFNFLEAEPDYRSFLAMMEFVQRPSVRRALHVGNNTFRHFEPNGKAEFYLRDDLIQSVAPWVAELLNHIRICVYHGQMDLLTTYRSTVRYLQTLNFSGAESYKTAKRQVWRVDGDVAGYAKIGGNLVEVLVRNAGHLATADQPKWTLDMIRRFIMGENFGSV